MDGMKFPVPAFIDDMLLLCPAFMKPVVCPAPWFMALAAFPWLPAASMSAEVVAPAKCGKL